MDLSASQVANSFNPPNLVETYYFHHYYFHFTVKEIAQELREVR